jgi:predicted unusual protein kinase regulating ubiquinone biosynthesis (AarF/ABC1/UbiB family)
MKASFGPPWLDSFESFDRIPFAAASIGQVHNATLSASVSPTGNPEPVAVKIQFPNVADSIESDLGYVKMLLSAGSLLPKGLFLDKTIQVMKSELHDECNYEREASFLRKFGSSGFLGNDERFKVPWVWEGSTKSVLVMERVDGHSVGAAVVRELSQRDRDDVSIAPLLIKVHWPLTLDWVDCDANNRPLLERAFRVPNHANRPELDQLPVEPSHTPNRTCRFRGESRIFQGIHRQLVWVT